MSYFWAMTKEQAEKEKSKYANLVGKILVHKEYQKKMHVLELGVEQKAPGTAKHYIYCRMKGELGEVVEPIEYVLKHYAV